MKRTIKRSVALCLLAACASASGYSNPIEGGSTQTVSNQWNVAVPWLMVGSNTEGNSLVVDGGQVNNQIGYIGNNISSSNNSATVTGTGSVWNSAMELSVGNAGSGNTLTVADGGRVDTAKGYVGNNSGSNTATIDGPGSQLNAATLHVGHLGSGNQLNVSNGGKTETANGTIGYWIGADGNIATVQGSNSLWQSSATINVGDYGSENQLIIDAGGRTESPLVNLGVHSMASNNTLTVTGDGSILDAPEIHIGGSTAGAGGTGNRIEVQNGGTVATTDLNIYSGNRFDLNNGGRLAVSTNFNAAMSGFNFNSGGTLEVGGELTGMGLEIEDQRTVVVNGVGANWNFKGQDLDVGMNTSGNALVVTNGGQVSSGQAEIGRRGDNNTVDVAGTGSVWNSGSDLFVGFYGSENSMTISEGGRILSGNTRIGHHYGGESNSVVVTGSGSEWKNKSDLSVGYDGTGNSLVISDGARVQNDNGFVGVKNDAVGNSALVTGAKSSWNNHGLLVIGQNGNGNRLTVENGGRVESADGYIGFAFSSDSNSVLVTGNGSIWSNTDDLYVGRSGISNVLLVDGGGRVESDKIYIGGISGSQRNCVILSGEGSVLEAKESIRVGFNSSGNRLVITDGGRAESSSLYLGRSDDSADNLVLVDGLSSVLNTEMIYIYGRGGNKLSIENGGLLNALSTSLLGDGNSIEVRGDGSVLKNSRDIGVYDSNNALMISDGGRVESDKLYVGYNNNEDANLIHVDGINSVLSSAGIVSIGYAGNSNRLSVTDGALVENTRGDIGFSSGADSNSVLISGQGSAWNNSEALYLGGHRFGTSWINGGTGNSLTVSNGGWVQVGDIGTNNLPEHGSAGVVSVGGLGGAEMVVANGSRIESDIGYIGREANMSGSVVVTGTGSVWENTGGLDVGIEGSDNSLSILNGARVEGSSSYIGYGMGASNNSVTVSGSGSLWNNRIRSRPPVGPTTPHPIGALDPLLGQTILHDMRVGGMYVGYKGSGNSLSISDGGEVWSGNGIIGLDEAAHENAVFVTGQGSFWESEGAIFVGVRGSDNSLLADDGARVQSEVGYIGESEGSENNRVVISGEGSRWDMGEDYFVRRFSFPDLSVGYAGSGNSLLIEEGGRVQNVNGVIGYAENANGNRVVVSGEGSVWQNTGWWDSSNPRPVQNNLQWREPRDIPSQFNPVQTGIDPLTGQTMPVKMPDWSTMNKSEFILRSGINPITGQTVPVYESVETGQVYLTNVTMLALSMGDLSIGRDGSNNNLLVEDGALVFNDHGIVGETATAWSNAVSVVGPNSEWRNAGDLYLGGRMSQTYTLSTNGWGNSWVDGGRGNSLYVADGGLVSVGRDLHNRNYSTVSVDPGGHIAISSNYYQDATSVLRFGVETNAVGAPLSPFVSVGGTAEFEEGATLQYHSNVGVLDFDTFYTNLIVEANQLIIAGITNANAVDLQALNLDGSLVEVMLWEQDQDIYGLVGRRHLADSAGFAPDSDMALLSKEIDDLSLLGNPTAVRHINLLNGMSSAQQNAQLTQRYTQGTPTYRHRQGVLGGQKQVMAQTRAFQSASRSRAARPEGAAGPHKADQELRGWMRGYGSWASHDGTPRSDSGFDQNVYGTVVGLDKAYGNMLLGAAGGYARSDLTQDNNDSSDAETGFGVLYSSFGSVDWFGDLNLSYGRSAIQTHSGTVLGGEGDFDADNFAIYLGGGKEVRPEESSLLFTPEAALTIGYYGQESYNDGLMDVDAYDRWSFQSRLGAALAVEKQAGSVVLKPEARVYWLHEFNADPDRIGYSLIGGGGNYTFGIQAPDEDIFEVGVGFSATFSDRLELALDVDAQQSGLYHAVTVGARAMYEF